MAKLNIFTLPVLAVTLLSGGCGGSGGQDAATMQNMKHEILVARNAAPAKYGEVLYGSDTPKYGSVQIQTVPMARSCNYLKAKRGTQVVHVNTRQARQVDGGPLYTVKESNLNGPSHSLNGLDLGTIVVTETEHPVTLVLSSYYSTLWNIQIAPGASVEGVLTMSTEPSAVYAPGVDPKKISMISSQYNDVNNCFVQPYEYFDAEAQAKTPTAGNYKRTAKDLAKFREREQNYKNWLAWIDRKVGPLKIDIQKETGIGYHEGMDTRLHYSHGFKAALVGPVPAAPLPQPVISGTVYATRAEMKSCGKTMSIFADFGTDAEIRAKYPTAFMDDKDKTKAIIKKLEEKPRNCRFVQGKTTQGGR